MNSLKFNLVGFNYRDRYASSVAALICFYVLLNVCSDYVLQNPLKSILKIMWVSATVLSEDEGLSESTGGRSIDNLLVPRT